MKNKAYVAFFIRDEKRSQAKSLAQVAVLIFFNALFRQRYYFFQCCAGFNVGNLACKN